MGRTQRRDDGHLAQADRCGRNPSPQRRQVILLAMAIFLILHPPFSGYRTAKKKCPIRVFHDNAKPSFSLLTMYLFSCRFNNTGAIEAVKAKTASLSEDPRIIALLIFWFFALFGEGLAGFAAQLR